MPTHSHHPDKEIFYFITFTCHKWLPLFEKTQIYDYLENWFEKLSEKGCLLCGYVIMPNHMHLIVYQLGESGDLSKIIANAKRFLAYELVKRLKAQRSRDLLQTLAAGVQENERQKGKKHQVFRLSFDAKPLSAQEVEKVLDYLHRNPVSGAWNLVTDYANYAYSSASYYETGDKSRYSMVDYRAVTSMDTSESSVSKPKGQN